MKSTTRTFLSAAAVAAAVVFGMILAGGLGFTPFTSADSDGSVAAAKPGSGVTGSQVILPSFADIAARAMPSVVTIAVTDFVNSGPRQRRQDPFEFFFGPRDPWHGPNDAPEEQEESPDGDQMPQRSGGTGFIIDPAGLILTNHHVVENGDKIVVRLDGDGKDYKAEVVGSDPATDLALIRIDAGKDLPYLPFGNSDSLRVGEWVMAIGNPLEFEHTVTVGVVSAKGRSLSLSDETRSFENFIQTDAAINFGNSGGPLINVAGEVIGINSAISRFAQNIGFAVPVNVAKFVIPQLKTRGKVVRGFLGIRIRNLDPDTVEAFGLPIDKGAFVEAVEPGKPAAVAGIEKGDAIVEVDGHTVSTTRDLIDYVSAQPPGSKVKIKLYRNGKTAKTVTATLVEREGGEEPEETEKKPDKVDVQERIGMSVQAVTAALRRYYRIDDDAEGVVVTKVKPVSSAAEAGLREGDLITEANGERVESLEDFRKQVERSSEASFLRFYVHRFQPEPASFFAIVKIDSKK